MTPSEFKIIVDIYGEKQKQEAEKDLLNSYMMAYFQRIDKLEAFETYRSKLDETEDKKDSMTDSEMLKKVEQLNRMFGGSAS